MRLRLLVMAALIVLPTTAPAATKTTPESALHRIQRSVAAINAEAKTPEGEKRVVSRLGLQLNVSPDVLQDQHTNWGLPYGEMAMAYGFARASRSGKTPEDVVEMRKGGKDWLVIAKELGVKVDTVANRMKRYVPPKTKR